MAQSARTLASRGLRTYAVVALLAACSSANGNPPSGGSALCAAPCATTDPTGSNNVAEAGAPIVTELGFTLDAPSVTIAQKDWRDVGITIARPADVTEALELEATNLPPGASATKVTVLQAQNRASLRITLGPTTPQGPYTVDITLRGTAKVVTNKLALQVVGSPGVIDTTFAVTGTTGGRAVGQSELSVTGFARQPDGKLVLGGVVGASPSRDFVAIRFSPDGAPDATFGDAGLAKYDFGGGDDYPHGFVAQSDGRLVMCGYQYDATVPSHKALFARWTADGKVDPDFGTGGKIALAPTQYAICYNLLALADDSLVGTGVVHNGTDYDFTLMRLSKAGVLDTAFGSPMKSGYAKIEAGSNDYAFATAMEANGNFIVTGDRGNGSNGADLTLMRYGSTGTPVSFASADKPWLNVISGGSGLAFGWGIAVQTDGKIVVGGSAPNTDAGDFVILRHDATGALDKTFGDQGKTYIHVGNADRLWDTKIDSAGRIVFAGVSDNNANARAVVGRLTPDGKRDPTFGNNGIVLLDFSADGPDYTQAFMFQPDGRILVAGTSLTAGKNVPWIARLWP